MSTMTDQEPTDTTYGHQITFPGPFTTLSSIEAANVRLGNHFFDKDSMRFFRSKVAPGVIGGRLFITSEQFVDSQGNADARRYTVRAAFDNGQVETVGEFQAYRTLEDARRAARAMVDVS